MLKIDEYIYTCRGNIVRLNHNKMLIAHNVVYALLIDHIYLDNK